MIALGIDPGTRRVGYGLVEGEPGGKARLIEAGILKITGPTDMDAMEQIKNGMDALIKKYRPEVMGVEKLFFSKNATTAIAVAEARGVILLAAKEKKIRVKEYSPNEVKIGVTGYGNADKKSVLKMVRLILGERDLDVIDDASDALALAILSTGDRLLDAGRC